jgi:hypothetical protein
MSLLFVRRPAKLPLRACPFILPLRFRPRGHQSVEQPASAASLLQLWPGSVAGGPSRSANSILQSCSRRQSLTKRGSIASVRRTKSGRSTSTGKRARATALEHPAHLDNDRGAVRFVREAQPPSIHSAHGRSCRRSLAMSRHAPRAYMFPAPTITTSEPVRLERQIRRLS